jgi:streptomycin 3"-adenylyltransferase
VTGQVEGIVDLVHEVLGEDAIGAYLHGSAVLGQMRPRSDVDVLVVSRRSLRDDERRVLVERLMAISGGGAPEAPRPVELSVVVEADIRPWRYPPTSDFLYGEWLRGEYERGVLPSRERSPDLAPLIAMVLLGDRPLIGPRPAEVFEPIPRDDLVRAAVAGIPGLLDDLSSDTRNVILTLARIWSTVATGEVRSKDAAADWALERLPDEHRGVLARARAIYLGAEEERWSDVQPHVEAHAAHVVREIEQLAREHRVAPVPAPAAAR